MNQPMANTSSPIQENIGSLGRASDHISEVISQLTDRLVTVMQEAPESDCDAQESPQSSCKMSAELRTIEDAMLTSIRRLKRLVENCQL